MEGNIPKGPPAVIAMPPSINRAPPRVPSTAKLQPDKSMAVKPKRPLNIQIADSIKRARAEKLVSKLAHTLSAILPEVEGSEIKFTKKEVFLDSKKIGDVQVDFEMVKVRIWLQHLGYPFGSLGPDELKDIFEVDRTEFEKMLEDANYLVLMGLQQRTLSHIGICFYKDFEIRMPPSFPLKE